MLFSLTATIVWLFAFFQRRKNTLLKEKSEREKHFEKEITNAQIEVREEAFRNISWELHDNIGQIITLAKVQLQYVQGSEIAQETLSQGLHELRSLSKSINPDTIRNIDLVNAVKQELDRLNRLNFLNAFFKVKGMPKSFSPKTEIIFFRVLQEFFSNTIKHAKATSLKVIFHFKTDSLKIIAEDNGQGFETNKFSDGMGLKNIKKRLDLINAKVLVHSEKDKGTELNIRYYYVDETQ